MLAIHSSNHSQEQSKGRMKVWLQTGFGHFLDKIWTSINSRDH